MIELTVALPIWNSPTIAWIALESLCMQRGIDFDWELVIMEEQIDHYGRDKIAEYADRLTHAGCKSIRYYPLDYRIPLPQKWQQMADKSSESSKYFVFWAADHYHPLDKLKYCYDLLSREWDWVGYRYYHFYSISQRANIHYDTVSIGRMCGNIAATLTRYVRELPESWLWSGIDSWLWRTIKPSNPVLIDDDSYKTGFASDGLNNISKDRKMKFQAINPPFFKTELTVKDIVSEEIITRMHDSLAEYHELHKQKRHAISSAVL